MNSYQHYVIRLEHENGRQYSSSDAREAIEEFTKTWKATVEKSQHWSLAVSHTYQEGEEEPRERSRTCPHIHVIYRRYKNSPGEDAIKSFVRRRRLRLYQREVLSLLGLAKYLLSGCGRKVLCEAGKSRPDGLQSGSAAVHKRQETYGYDIGSESEGDEDYRTTCEENRKSGSGKNEAPKTEVIRKATGQFEQEVRKCQTIKQLLLKYRCKDEPNLKRQMNNEEKQVFQEIMFGTKEWTKLWSSAREEAMTSVMDCWWEDQLKALPDDQYAYKPPVMSVNKSLRALTQVLDHQGWDKEQRKQFLGDVYRVMNNNKVRNKRNTLYLIGKTSSGKTLIATSLELSKVFSFNSGEYSSRSSDFHFEDMALACIAILNEPQIEAGKVDKFKVILEGGAFDTNVKFKSKSRVEGVPVIVTTNNEIWRYAIKEKETFEERMYRWSFKNKLPKSFDINGGLHPKMWLELIKHYGLTREIFKEESEEEFDISNFGGEANRPDNYIESDSEEERELAMVNIPDPVSNSLDVTDTREVHDSWCIEHEYPTTYHDEYDEWNLWPDWNKTNSPTTNRHVFIYETCGAYLYKEWFTLSLGLCDLITVLRDDITGYETEPDTIGERDIQLCEQLLQQLPGRECSVYAGPTTIHGAGGYADERTTRTKVQEWCRTVIKELNRRHDYYVATGYSSNIEEKCGRVHRRHVLEHIYNSRSEGMCEDVDRGWLYSKDDGESSSTKGNKRSTSDGDGSELRGGNQHAKKAKCDWREADKGYFADRDELDRYATRWTSCDEDQSFYICQCGFWLCGDDAEQIRLAGHGSCSEGWIGPYLDEQYAGYIEPYQCGWRFTTNIK